MPSKVVASPLIEPRPHSGRRTTGMETLDAAKMAADRDVRIYAIKGFPGILVARGAIEPPTRGNGYML